MYTFLSMTITKASKNYIPHMYENPKRGSIVPEWVGINGRVYNRRPTTALLNLGSEMESDEILEN